MNDLENKILNLIEKGELIAPELAQQYLQWQEQLMVFGIAIGIFSLICLPFIWRLFLWSEYRDNEFVSIVCIAGLMLLGCLGLILPIVCGYEYFMIINAPDVYLMKAFIR